MSGANFPSLIDQLSAASAEAKELLREVHGAVKDMRAVLAESAAERKRLDESVRAAVEAEVEEHVEAVLKNLGDKTKETIAAAEKGIYRRFDQISNLLLHGDTKGTGPNILALAADARTGAMAPGRRCPHCRALVDADTGLDGATTAKDGDVSVCWMCGGVARYTSDTTRLRRQTADEEREARADPELRRVVESITSRSAGRSAGR